MDIPTLTLEGISPELQRVTQAVKRYEASRNQSCLFVYEKGDPVGNGN